MKPKEPQPKLVSTGRFFVVLSAALAGGAAPAVFEYHAQGSVSRVTFGASIAACIIGCLIVGGMTWYANKPEG